MLISVLATEMTASRCCVVTALDNCQRPAVAIAIVRCRASATSGFPAPPKCRYQPGSDSDMWPPARDRKPNETGRRGRSRPSFEVHSWSSSGSRPHAWRHDIKIWAATSAGDFGISDGACSLPCDRPTSGDGCFSFWPLPVATPESLVLEVRRDT